MDIVLCVTGSVAASEAIKLAREFRRNDVEVKCFMSEAACEIIHPNSMEFATGNEVVTEFTQCIKDFFTTHWKIPSFSRCNFNLFLIRYSKDATLLSLILYAFAKS